MEHLAQARRLTLNRGVVLGELQRYVGPQIFVQGEHIKQEGLEIDLLHLAWSRLPRIDREVIHHVLHRAHLRDDGLRPADERLLVAGVELAAELDREALRGKLDRGQRVLDFVREPSRDFGPRRVALCLDEL